MRNITYLLGSGISIPSKFPSVMEITNRILSGDNIIRHTDGTYYISPPDPAGSYIPYDIATIRNAKLVNRILIELNLYYLYDFFHTSNYEEIFYVLNQIHEDNYREYENPIIKPFVDKLLPDIAKIATFSYSSSDEPWDYSKLFFESVNYIRDVVWRMLQIDIESGNASLNCIVDSLKDTENQNVNLFTLNHDLLLEDICKQNGIIFNNGFGLHINDIAYWHPRFIGDGKSKINIIKLHGSINWFQFPPNNLVNSLEAIGIPQNSDIRHLHDVNGNIISPYGGRPVFLMGTFNKILSYSNSIFAELFTIFRGNLNETNEMIVSGYSFNDKGVNSQIVEWMSSSPDKRMIVIHKEPEVLWQKARGAIRKNVDLWTQQGKIIILKAFIQEVSWKDIKKLLN